MQLLTDPNVCRLFSFAFKGIINSMCWGMICYRHLVIHSTCRLMGIGIGFLVSFGHLAWILRKERLSDRRQLDISIDVLSKSIRESSLTDHYSNSRHGKLIAPFNMTTSFHKFDPFWRNFLITLYSLKDKPLCYWQATNLKRARL